MSLLIQYLVKLTICLAVVWMFYHFILRKLTFYNSNRWYLLGYTLLSFFIPFVNISSFIEDRPNELIRLVPSVHQYTIGWEQASTCPQPLWSTSYDKWDLIAFALLAVAGIFFVRFAISFFSFLSLRKKAKLISADGINIYQVDKNIIPFSFGNSIFINTHLHTGSELHEIVKHEFVHVRQKHTIDIVWAEMLCIINWYNPFAWLLKRSIRQNLEFIADNKVIGNGIDKKQYQYLLLKVIGNRQFSIATQFNFSSLKKRIVMMNKSKSAKRQLGRFLFLLPVFAIILLSFRQSLRQSGVNATPQTAITDTVPEITVLNSKGYFIDIKDDNGNCLVVVKDKNKKEVKRVLLTEWNAKDDHYENLYGEILSPSGTMIEEKIKANNENITSVKIKGDIATVTLKNGKTEVYTLSLRNEKSAFEERCGINEVAVVSEPAEVSAVNRVTGTYVEKSVIADKFEINDNKAKMYLKNGKIEEYNLADPKEKEIFEERFGKVISPVKSPARVYTIVGEPREGLTETEPSETTAVSIIPPTKEVVVIKKGVALTTTEEVPVITIEPEILLTISRKTTREELESFRQTLKEKGFELSFDEIEHKDGILVKISGTLKSKDGQANFVGVDFARIIISQVKQGTRTYFRIDEVVKKKGVS